MNTCEMKAIMKRNDDTQEKLAEFMKMEVSSINSRINGKIEFRASEIVKIKKRYNMSLEEIDKIFFNDKAS